MLRCGTGPGPQQAKSDQRAGTNAEDEKKLNVNVHFSMKPFRLDMFQSISFPSCSKFISTMSQPCRSRLVLIHFLFSKSRMAAFLMAETITGAIGAGSMPSQYMARMFTAKLQMFAYTSGKSMDRSRYIERKKPSLCLCLGQTSIKIPERWCERSKLLLAFMISTGAKRFGCQHLWAQTLHFWIYIYIYSFCHV